MRVCGVTYGKHLLYVSKQAKRRPFVFNEIVGRFPEGLPYTHRPHLY